MYGIVTLVEGALGESIKGLWEGLASRYGADAVAGFNMPHFSYHIADDYDLERAKALLDRVASETPAFDLQMAGLGVIVHPQSLVFINLVRSAALSAVHAALWDEATDAGTGVIMYCETDSWLPHVTLGEKPVLIEHVAEIGDHFGDGLFLKPLRVDNLAIIEEMRDGHELRHRVALRDG